MEQKQNLTIDDIARELGVSKTTVSRAISGKGRISEATRARVQDFIAQCHYRPSAAAKSLAENRTYNLALVLPRSYIHLDLPFVRKSMNAICDEAYQWEYSVMVCLSTDDTLAPVIHTINNRKVDGVILSRTVENDALVELLRQRGIPFATMGSLPPACRGLATVEADHDQVGGCRTFTTAFLQNTREKVALLGNDMHFIVNQSRLAGFNQALDTLHYPRELVYQRTEQYTARVCCRTVDALLAEGVKCFLAMDDEICSHILSHLGQLGLQVPGDIRVGSLCASDLLTAFYPFVPSVEFNAAELGRIACRELLKSLKNEEYDPTPLLGYRLNME